MPVAIWWPLTSDEKCVKNSQTEIFTQFLLFNAHSETNVSHKV